MLLVPAVKLEVFDPAGWAKLKLDSTFSSEPLDEEPDNPVQSMRALLMILVFPIFRYHFLLSVIDHLMQ